MSKKQVIAVWLMGAFLLSGCATSSSRQQGISSDHADFVLVKIVSRPLAKKTEIIPSNTWSGRHLAIISDLLPHGIWEIGPDSQGRVATTNTIKDLSAWRTHLVTQKCIELKGKYVRLGLVGVNKKGLLNAIKLYESHWVGAKYNVLSQDGNYAVESVIYLAGGNLGDPVKSPDER